MEKRIINSCWNQTKYWIAVESFIMNGPSYQHLSILVTCAHTRTRAHVHTHTHSCTHSGMQCVCWRTQWELSSVTCTCEWPELRQWTRVGQALRPPDQLAGLSHTQSSILKTPQRNNPRISELRRSSEQRPGFFNKLMTWEHIKGGIELIRWDLTGVLTKWYMVDI